MIFDEITTMRKLMLLHGIVGSKSIEDMAVGNPLTFLTDLAKPLKSLVANFLPVQASGTPAPDNVLPITGWDAVNVFHAGKNLLNPVAENMIPFENNSYNRYTLENGQIITTGNSLVGFLVEVKEQKKYSFSFASEANTILEVFSYSAKPNKIRNADTQIAYSTIKKGSFTTPQGCKYVVCAIVSTVSANVISDFQCEVGQTATTYEPYNGTVHPVSFPSTIYGGYVDLITGEVWKTWQSYTFTGDEYMSVGSYSGTGGVRINSNVLDSLAPKYLTGMSNKAAKEASVPSQITRLGFRVSSGSSLLSFFVPDSMFDGDATADKFKSWLSENGLMICVELSEPVLITTLTPQQINAIKGNNTIWSDANGDMTAVYLKKG